MELKIKKVKENAILPTRGDEEAAGIDLYACLDDKEINIIHDRGFLDKATIYKLKDVD